MDWVRLSPWLLSLATVLGPVSAIRGRTAYEYLQGTEHIGALVHLMEWSYTDIKNECNFLDDSGYYGIIISPPVEHILINNNPGWKERYMAVNINNLVTRSGNRKDLEDMVSYCTRTNGLRIFVDLNLNNMLKSSIKEEVKGFGLSKATPKEYKYEGIGISEFHKHCKIKNMNDVTQVRDCEVDEMQDLDTSNANLRKLFVALMNDLINMGVTGFRMALARHIHPDDLYKIYQQLTKTKHGHQPIIIHDINDLEESTVTSKDYGHIGTTTDYEYSTNLAKYFLKKDDRDMQEFLDHGEMDVNSPLRPRDTEKMVFLYNHVLQRNENWKIIKLKNKKAYMMATAFMLSWPYGIPTILSSYKDRSGAPQYPTGRIMSPRPDDTPVDQVDYKCIDKFNCEHRMDTTIRMAKFNADVKHKLLSKLRGSSTDHWFAYSREDQGFIFFNAGDKDITKTFRHMELPPGEYCDLASGNYEYNQCTGKMIVIGDDMKTTITIEANDPYGYVAICRWSMIVQWIKRVKSLIDKDEDVKYLVNTFGKVVKYVGGKAVTTVSRVINAINDPDVTGQKVLEAAVTKEGASIIQATGRFVLVKAQDAVKASEGSLRDKIEANQKELTQQQNQGKDQTKAKKKVRIERDSVQDNSK